MSIADVIVRPLRAERRDPRVRGRQHLATAVVGLLMGSHSLLGQSTPPGPTSPETQELQTIVKVLDGIVEGERVPNDVSLTWVHEDFLQAPRNSVYVPFTVSLDGSKLGGGKVSI